MPKTYILISINTRSFKTKCPRLALYITRTRLRVGVRPSSPIRFRFVFRSAVAPHDVSVHREPSARHIRSELDDSPPPHQRSSGPRCTEDVIASHARHHRRERVQYPLRYKSVQKPFGYFRLKRFVPLAVSREPQVRPKNATAVMLG